MKVAAAPTVTGPWVSHDTGMPWFAWVRKLVLAPSSSVTLRAALSASTAFASALPGRPTSVGWTRRFVPLASTTSPYWFVV